MQKAHNTTHGPAFTTSASASRYVGLKKKMKWLENINFSCLGIYGLVVPFIVTPFSAAPGGQLRMARNEGHLTGSR